ncbi:AB hydrolase superfamily protein [Vanrija pseudolonga]|uniref:AB hydrolase superfamily protein n=1 Tax=Vanrija pseudolonga TaxID=143232 RepID=A0AAF0YHP6_9TREE|nr:AB hydrolase superfamily protein [Vanrija pseudolonga]
MPKPLPTCAEPHLDRVYKTAHGVDIPLRIFPAAKPSGPWLLWLHGGGFIGGKHATPNAWVVPAFHGRGYTVVSAAYRFLPQASFGDILTDVKDAFGWCRANLGSIVPGTSVDIYAVGGDSAGGALACLAGHELSPRPRAILNLYGLVDATDPSFHVASGRKATSGAFSREEIEAAIRDRDPANAVTICPWEWEMEPVLPLAELRRCWGMPAFEVTAAHRLRGDMNAVLGSEGRLVDTLVRRDMLTDEAYQRALVDASAAKRPLGPEYPATFFLHGDADVVVPVSQSRDMAAALRGLGVPVGEVYDAAGGHCFDVEIEGEEDAGWDVYVVPAVQFICAHVEGRASN